MKQETTMTLVFQTRWEPYITHRCVSSATAAETIAKVELARVRTARQNGAHKQRSGGEVLNIAMRTGGGGGVKVLS